MRVPRLTSSALAFVVGALLFSGFVSSQESVFQKRLDRFLAGDYDPLTTPVEFFESTEKLAGGNTPDPERASVSERTIPAGALAAARAYAKEKQSLALIVVRGDKVEFEYYGQGAGRDTRFNPQSMSKTVLALAVGTAIRDGFIQSVDDRIDKYLPRLSGDPRGAITIKNLLQMSAGLAQISTSFEVNADNPAIQQHFASDFIEPIFHLELVDEPGTRWDYNNNESNLLGHLLTVATGKRYAAWLSEKLWQPLGLRDADLYLDRPGGSVMMSCCIFSRPMDFLRIGMMMRDKGMIGGKQVVPASWIEAMTTPAESWRGYGYQTWLGDRNVAPEYPENAWANTSWASESYVAKDTIIMNGFGFQRTWIIPSRDLVIMRAGRVWPQEWDESVIPNLLVRAIDSVGGGP